MEGLESILQKEDKDILEKMIAEGKSGYLVLKYINEKNKSSFTYSDLNTFTKKVFGKKMDSKKSKWLSVSENTVQSKRVKHAKHEDYPDQIELEGLTSVTLNSCTENEASEPNNNSSGTPGNIVSKDSPGQLNSRRPDGTPQQMAKMSEDIELIFREMYELETLLRNQNKTMAEFIKKKESQLVDLDTMMNIYKNKKLKTSVSINNELITQFKVYIKKAYNIDRPLSRIIDFAVIIALYKLKEQQ